MLSDGPFFGRLRDGSSLVSFNLKLWNAPKALIRSRTMYTIFPPRKRDWMEYAKRLVTNAGARACPSDCTISAMPWDAGQFKNIISYARYNKLTETVASASGTGDESTISI